MKYIEAVAIATFCCMATMLAVDMFVSGEWWYAPVSILITLPMADLLCGTVHWIADRYGNENVPFFGPRFIGPFRRHHTYPKEIVSHSFREVNGNTALLAAPFLCTVYVLPLPNLVKAMSVFLATFSMFTNQIHKWSHMDRPPMPVRILQKCKVILPKENHDEHHVQPYETHYCITTGWFNDYFHKIQLFERMEQWIEKRLGIKVTAD